MVANDKIQAVFRYVVEGIAGQQWKIGSRIPTDKELAAQFGASRMDVFRALEQLKTLGIISSRKRAGKIVMALPDAETRQRLLNVSSRAVYVLQSAKPYGIQWDQSTLTALEEILTAAGCAVHFRQLPEIREQFREIIAESMREGAAGLMIFPDSDDREFLRTNCDLLVNVSTPIFMLNRGNETSELDFVTSLNIDNLGDAIHLSTRLRRNGFRRMLLTGVNMDAESLWHLNRRRGLKLGFTGEGVTPPEAPPPGVDDPEYCLDEAVKDPNLIIVALHSREAAAVVRHARARKLRPGIDYNLVSFDDDPALREYGLSVVAVRRRELGEIFARMLVDRTWHRDYHVWDSVKISGEFLQRESCRELKDMNI